MQILCFTGFRRFVAHRDLGSLMRKDVSAGELVGGSGALSFYWYTKSPLEHMINCPTLLGGMNILIYRNVGRIQQQNEVLKVTFPVSSAKIYLD